MRRLISKIYHGLMGHQKMECPSCQKETWHHQPSILNDWFCNKCNDSEFFRREIRRVTEQDNFLKSKIHLN